MDQKLLRGLQLRELDCTLEVDRICKKHNIRYFLAWGSALGAKRHQGFIPWDDDMDLAMMQDDYERFLTVCETELDTKHFFLQTRKTDPNFPLSSAKIRINNTTSMDAIGRSVPMHYGICIDIFCLRYAPTSLTEQKKLYKMTRKYQSMLLYPLRKPLLENERLLAKILYHINQYSIFHHVMLNRLEKRINQRYRQKTNTILDLSGSTFKNVFYPVGLIEQLEDMPFEGYLLPCPKNIDQYLTHTFGDYMQLPDPENRCGHANIIVDLEKSFEEYRL